MEIESLEALSPLDGRYARATRELARCFCEAALMKYRTLVEVEFLLALCGEPGVEAAPPAGREMRETLKGWCEGFTTADAERIKEFEAVTNHDVKAVEYFLAEKLESTPWASYRPMIHFACTSEDINNLAYALMIKEALSEVILPHFARVLQDLEAKAVSWAAMPMLALTHGQPASPTTLGKEFRVFAERLRRQVHGIRRVEVLGKLNGATGNFCAHHLAYPDVNWPAFSERLIRSLGLVPNRVTTQIEPHDFMAELFDAVRRAAMVLIDLCRDVWGYISLGWIKQARKEGEVGSSTMPHKVNPIDFENAEGNLGLAVALLGHLSEKLPISRWQRDLTDSTVQRNLGVALGHVALALSSLARGLGKIEPNEKAMARALDDNWAVLGEGLQTVMRKWGAPNAYEKLKDLTRGERVGREELVAFVEGLDMPEDEKARLKALTPAAYIGLAEEIAARR